MYWPDERYRFSMEHQAELRAEVSEGRLGRQARDEQRRERAFSRLVHGGMLARFTGRLQVAGDASAMEDCSVHR